MNSIGNHLASQTPYTYGIIDKTALLVAKGGDGYEKRIWREQSHTRFDFLLPNHPYRPYYEQKVEECKVEVAGFWPRCGSCFGAPFGIPNKYCFTYMLRSRAGTVRPCRFPKTQQWVT